MDAHVVAEDRVEGPARASVLASPGAKYALLNYELLGAYEDDGHGL
ncbi:MAG: hypothetical protein ABWK00_01730 [Desulfurococcaceae archaeon]